MWAVGGMPQRVLVFAAIFGGVTVPSCAGSLMKRGNARQGFVTPATCEGLALLGRGAIGVPIWAARVVSIRQRWKVRRSAEKGRFIGLQASIDGHRQKKPTDRSIHFVLDNMRSTDDVSSIFRTADAAHCAEVVTCGSTQQPEAELGTTSFPTRHIDSTLLAVKTLKAQVNNPL